MTNYYPALTVARVVHAAMMVLQEAQQDPSPAPPWAYLKPEVRANAVAGVEAIRKGMTPEENHERWCTQLRSQGWKRGDRKDPYARTHPMLKPWAELTEAEQERDRLFAWIVLALSLPATVKVTLTVPDAAPAA